MLFNEAHAVRSRKSIPGRLPEHWVQAWQAEAEPGLVRTQRGPDWKVLIL